MFSYICEDFVVNDTIDGKIASVTQSLARFKSLRAGDHSYAILAEPFGVPQSIYYATGSSSTSSSMADHHVTYRTTTTVNHQTLTLSRTHYWRQQQHHPQPPTHYVSGKVGGHHHYATLRTPAGAVMGGMKSGQITVSEHLRLARMNQQKQQHLLTANNRKRVHADASTASAVLAPIKLCKVVRWVRPQCSTSPTTSNSSSGVESMCSTRHGSTSPPHLSPVDFTPLANVTQLHRPSANAVVLHQQPVIINRIVSTAASKLISAAPSVVIVDDDDVVDEEDDDDLDVKATDKVPSQFVVPLAPPTKQSAKRRPSNRRRRPRTTLSVRKTPSSQSLTSQSSAKSRTSSTTTLSKMPAAPLPRGMCNMGNTCYVNCVVQALRSLPKIDMNLTMCMANAQRRKSSDDSQPQLTPFCMALSDTLTALATPGTPPFTPKALMATIDALFPQFSGSKMQQDAHDLLHAILNRLYEESGVGRGGSRSRSRQSPASGISDEFRFEVQSKVTCKHCNRVSTADETYTDLSLELPTGAGEQDSVSRTYFTVGNHEPNL